MHADSSAAAPTGWARWSRALLVLLLAWLAWGAFHDECGGVPLVSEIDLAIHEFGHMLFMSFGVALMFCVGGLIAAGWFALASPAAAVAAAADVE